MKNFFLFILISIVSQDLMAQSNRWQQHVKYTMNIDMDVQANKYDGRQKIEYTNNSPDTLNRVFIHLYWNAFQPNSMMDVRSRRQGSVSVRRDRNGNEIPDWDSRVRDRIVHLNEDEIGYQQVKWIKMNGRTQKTKLHETILEVILDRPILPQSKATFEMEWNAQVPLQVRRSGRDNPSTGVRFTMTQWFPKIAEYDYMGWHPDPYIGREFYGVWGDFDVTININKNYMIAGSGVLQNPNSIGFGYEAKGAKVATPKTDKLSWHFIAKNVHDFAWAADPEFRHIKKQIKDGPVIHVVYNAADKEEFNALSAQEKAQFSNDFNKYVEYWDGRWQTIADAAVTVYPFIKTNFGKYPYEQYSFIHGGDGGMEYAMCTMLAGPSLGTAFHEWMHSWYQMILGTNESLYAWMDEGFTEWSTNLVEEYYRQKVSIPTIANDPAAIRRSDSMALLPPAYHRANYNGYLALARSPWEEPMTTHADHFNTNYAYSTASYSKGNVFVEQLGYIVGAEVRNNIMLEYYNQWKFKHPNADDFIRVAEKVSNMELDWYKMYWINTTNTIDYKIDSLWDQSGKTNIRLRNVGSIPMPVDVKITFRDGSSEWHYIPMSLMFGEKPAERGQDNRTVYESWKWTHPTYQIQSAKRLNDIVSVEIDPSHRMADVDRRNNRIELRWPNQ